jgi:hypothetical protein
VKGIQQVLYLAEPSGLNVAATSSGCLSRCGEKPASPRLGSMYLQCSRCGSWCQNMTCQ